MLTEAPWFAGDDVTRRRCFGRRWFRPFPAAKGVGKRGEMVSDAVRFQIERKQGRRRPVPRGHRRAEAAELELDLELGWLWRQMDGSGGRLGVWESDRKRERGSGSPYIGWPRSTVGATYGCPRDRLGWPLEREWRARGCSWEWSRVPGRERRSGTSCTRPQELHEHWPSRAALGTHHRR